MVKEPNSTDKHVGRRICARRLMLQMTQATLAQAIGVTFQQVQKYEKGENRIGASRLQKITHAQQVPISFYFEGGPSASSPSTTILKAPLPSYVSEFFAFPEGMALTNAFVRIKNPKLKRALVYLLEHVAGGNGN